MIYLGSVLVVNEEETRSELAPAAARHVDLISVSGGVAQVSAL